MQGFGLTDWVAVSANERLGGMLDVLKRHRSGGPSNPVLESLRRVDTLAEALRDCDWAVGTTMRTLGARPRLSTRELATETRRRRDARWALVFGTESNGLQDSDLEHCDAVSFIPSSEDQPSLNLSQAVVVYAHELAAARALGPLDGPILAGEEALQSLKDAMVSALRSEGAFNGGANRGLVNELLVPMLRAGLTTDEAAQWRAAWRSRAASAH